MAGIGVGFACDQQGLMITAILPDGPAARSQKIDVGDYCVTIDGRSAGLNAHEATKLILGIPDTKVVLGIRKGSSSILEQIELVREFVRPPPDIHGAAGKVFAPVLNTKPMVSTTALQSNPVAAPIVSLGLRLVPKGPGELIIEAIRAGSSADAAKFFECGDVLVMVDGHDVTSLEQQKVVALTSGHVGTVVKVGILRGPTKEYKEEKIMRIFDTNQQPNLQQQQQQQQQQQGPRGLFKWFFRKNNNNDGIINNTPSSPPFINGNNTTAGQDAYEHPQQQQQQQQDLQHASSSGTALPSMSSNHSIVASSLSGPSASTIAAIPQSNAQATPIGPSGKPYGRPPFLLHSAAATGSTKGIASILKVKSWTRNQVLVDILDSNGVTPLFAAARGGHLPAVELLLSFGADLNFQTETGLTAMMIAAKNGHQPVVEYLVFNGADVARQTHDGVSAIFLACQHNYVGIVKFLAEQGADLNCQTADGTSPCLLAVVSGNMAMLEWLHRHGARLDIKTKSSSSLLIAAAQHGHLGVCQWLVAHGLNVNDAMDDGCTCMLVAAQRGFLSVVGWLGAEGADVNVAVKDGATPLLVAAQSGHLAIVQWLLAHNASIEAKLHQNRENAVILAAQRGHQHVVDWLLQNGADVNVSTLDGQSLAHIAVSHSDFVLLELVGSYSGDVDMVDAAGKTALMYACEANLLRFVEWLLHHGADPNATTQNGDTALMISAAKGCHEVAHCLVANSADPNVTNQNSDTALHLAAELGKHRVVEILAAAGADLSKENHSKNTPFIIACQKGHLSVAQSLLASGARFNPEIKSRALADNYHRHIVQWLVNYNHFGCKTSMIPANSAGFYHLLEALATKPKASGVQTTSLSLRPSIPKIIHHQQHHAFLDVDDMIKGLDSVVIGMNKA